MSNVVDKSAVMRDKRAQGIAAMGLVKREGDRFRVATPSLRGRSVSYEVWRDAEGKVRCSCLEFEEQSSNDTNFRCEHILAVKHSLLAKNTETINKQVTMPTNVEAKERETTPKNKITASEKPTKSKIVSKKEEGFEREQNKQREPIEVITGTTTLIDSTVHSLAENRDEEEQTMNRVKNQPSLITEEERQNTLPLEAETDGSATVIPMGPMAFANTLRLLHQPIEPKLIKTREGWTDRSGNKHMVEYIEWHTVADLLDRLVPTWSHSVRNVVQIGDMVAVTAAITIDGVTREGVGTGTADNETGIKKAEHDALKRAAIKFGIARDLYQRESEMVEVQGTFDGGFPRDPLAKSMADLVTPKQLGMIRALGRELNIDIEEECQSVLRCRTEELSKRAASSFIERLKSMQQETNAGGIMRRAS
jgi:hypothetical protein